MTSGFAAMAASSVTGNQPFSFAKTFLPQLFQSFHLKRPITKAVNVW